ncbi:MAG: hypothetical protein JKX73_06250, partial [Flavobacteriales bacterium]|nr:hypothetical protein [Flavobacteriales bacterium]
GDIKSTGTIDASVYTIGGNPIQLSQWVSSGNDISYTTGKVGIGTSSPSTDFEVDGDVKVSGILTIGNNSIVIDGGHNQLGQENTINTSSGDMFIQNLSNDNTVIGLQTSSNLGVGTASPMKKLHVKTNHAGGGQGSHLGIRIEDLTGGGGQPVVSSVWDFEPERDLLFGVSKLYIGTPGSPKLVISEDGDVGIGTTFPGAADYSGISANLEVVGTTHGAIAVSASNGNSSFVLAKNQTPMWHLLSRKTEGNRFEIFSATPGNIGARLIISQDGKVGIGAPNTTSSKFVVRGDGNAGLDQIFAAEASHTTGSHIISTGYNSSDNTWRLRSGGDSPASDYAIYMQGNEVFRIKNNGTVGIGTPLTSNPHNYLLAVNGTIGAKKVKVEISSQAWSDHVFSKDYQMMSWREKENFYKREKHLPGIPSAREIDKEGLDITETMSGMTLNVEENRLDITELYKRIEKLEKDNKVKDEEIEKLNRTIRNR